MMSTLSTPANPFKVFTPESMSANDVHALFVHPFTDFNKIHEPGHTMVHGPRGCGKSMIFRYLLPDCQCLATDQKLDSISFLAFLVSIKNTVPNLTEFRRLEDKHAEFILNEHLLVIFSATKVFQSLSLLDLPETSSTFSEARHFFDEVFSRRLRSSGGNAPHLADDCKSAQDVFRVIMETCDGLYAEVVQYARRLAFITGDAVPYTSALCGYTDFLLPLLSSLRSLSFFPTAPVYLLIDDADYLSHPQTMALNSWISTRTQGEISIKVSTQLRYKTYQTPSGLPIQAPHDYQSINIADIYTTKRGRYLNRLEEIIRRRLSTAGISATPSQFFPADEAQEQAIANMAEKIKADWHQQKRGYRARDDAIRYARPEYIRSLGGKSKSRSTYSYSGFEHLVHISSGLVRYFLEPAAVMFDEQKSSRPSESVTEIAPAIQNQVVRNEANHLMFSEFSRIRIQGEAQKSEMDKLFNLLNWLGGTFFLKLVSNDAERRVFSVALSGNPDPEVVKIFEHGVRYAYFHRSSIGNKDGTGRTQLYVLTRRLAPYFNLDPTTFAGYLWTTSDILLQAMENPEPVLRKMRNDGIETTLESGQLTLFDD